MKVCKKCKTHVANKAKICKKCGADVSKAKIITSSSTASKNKKTATNPKTTSKVQQKNTPIADTKSKTKDKVVVTTKQTKKQTTTKKQTPTKKQTQAVEKKTTTAKPKTTAATKTTKKKAPVKATTKKQTTNKKSKTNKQQVSKSKRAFSKTLSTTKKGGQKTWNILKAAFVYLGIELFQSLKTTGGILLDILKTTGKGIKRTHAKVKKIQENRPKKNKEEKYVTYKIEEYVEPKPAKKEKKEVPRKKRIIKYAIISLFIVSVSLGLYLVGQEIYKDIAGTTNKIVVTEKATREKVFSMEDIITYNNVDYKVVKIETSKGNSYKSPKAGHQFLIVTVYIKNNTGGKVRYSYENWTMSNSKGEEKKRIFSSINVDTALYSGELVIGGIKTGSMVFEQPINDPKLKMNFYELKKDDDGNEVIDEAKRVFSISVKVPSKKAKQAKESTKSEDVKVVKTNTKNKS